MILTSRPIGYMHYIQYICVCIPSRSMSISSIRFRFYCGSFAVAVAPRLHPLQWRALRPVIDVSFSIIYCCILRLHSNPLMARTWPAIRRNQKLWYFWKFLLPAPAAPQNVSPSLSLSLTAPVIIIIYAWPIGRDIYGPVCSTVGQARRQLERALNHSYVI